MAKLTAGQIYQQLTGAGFDAASAVIMTSIALAESGGSDTATGDTALEDQVWGPSYGLYQVRTLKGQTGSGSDRDIAWLSAGDANQAAAAYDISDHGATFAPWSTYTSGAYERFLGQAQAAAAAAPATSTTSTASTATPADWGPSWLPWNWPGDIAGGVESAGSDIVHEIGGLALTATFVLLGAGLLGAGLWVLARPATARLRQSAQQVEQRAQTAASVAALA